MFEIEILQDSHGLTERIDYSIGSLVGNQNLDLYYFFLAGEILECTSSFEIVIAYLLDYWIQQLKALQEGETIHLPIDFSDQYIGCLQVEKRGQTVKLDYGFTRIEGHSVSPSNPQDFSRRVRDFSPISIQSEEINLDLFIKNISIRRERVRAFCQDFRS